MKDPHWFRHDIDASEGRRFTMLRLKGGYEAHGVYWALMKPLYKSNNCYPFATPDDKQVLASTLHLETEALEKVIECCIECDLLQIIDGNLTSEKVANELLEQKVLSKKRKKAGTKGGKVSASKRQANVKQNQAQTDSTDKTDRQYRQHTKKPTEQVTSEKAFIGEPPLSEETKLPGPLQELFKSQEKIEAMHNVWMTEKEYNKLRERWGPEKLKEGFRRMSSWSTNLDVYGEKNIPSWKIYRQRRNHAQTLNKLLEREEKRKDL